MSNTWRRSCEQPHCNQPGTRIIYTREGIPFGGWCPTHAPPELDARWRSEQAQIMREYLPDTQRVRDAIRRFLAGDHDG